MTIQNIVGIGYTNLRISRVIDGFAGQAIVTSYEEPWEIFCKCFSQKRHKIVTKNKLKPYARPDLNLLTTTIKRYRVVYKWQITAKARE